MDPNELIPLIDSALPAEHWARSVLAFLTLVFAALTALGKCMDVLVPAFRRWADETATTADDAAADRLEAFAEWLARVNARTPRVTAGTRNLTATPSKRRKRRVPPLPVLLLALALAALPGCKPNHTQTALNVGGEALYAIDDGLAPWTLERRTECTAELEALPPSVATDYEGIYAECMRIPSAIAAALETVRTALARGNAMLRAHAAGEPINCAAIDAVLEAGGVLVAELERARDLGIPPGVIDAARSIAALTCSIYTEETDQ